MKPKLCFHMTSVSIYYSSLPYLKIKSLALVTKTKFIRIVFECFHQYPIAGAAAELDWFDLGEKCINLIENSKNSLIL